MKRQKPVAFDVIVFLLITGLLAACGPQPGKMQSPAGSANNASGNGQSQADTATLVAVRGETVKFAKDSPTASGKVGSLTVSLTLSPYPAAAYKKTSFAVTVKDDQGQAVADAAVALNLTMPSMYMPPNKVEAPSTGGGSYQGSGQFTMGGGWQIEVVVVQGGKQQSVFFTLGL